MIIQDKCTICKKYLKAEIQIPLGFDQEELKTIYSEPKIILPQDIKEEYKINDLWCPECGIKYRI